MLSLNLLHRLSTKITKVLKCYTFEPQHVLLNPGIYICLKQLITSLGIKMRIIHNVSFSNIYIDKSKGEEITWVYNEFGAAKIKADFKYI